MTIIQYYNKDFRHNDLKPDNILLKFNNIKGGYYEYKIFGITYYIPNIGITIKIWDFGISNSFDIKNEMIPDIQKLVRNNNIKNYGITNEYNHIYDIHYLMNILLTSDLKLLKNIENKEYYEEFIQKILRTGDEDILSKLKVKGHIEEGDDEIELINKNGLFLKDFRLTNIVNNSMNVNLIPNDLISFGDIFLSDEEYDIFKLLQIKTEEEIKHMGKLLFTYDSGIKNLTEEQIEARPDSLIILYPMMNQIIIII